MTTFGYRHFFSMGTRFDLVVAAIDHERLDEVSRDLQSSLRDTEDTISNYSAGTVFSHLNSQAFYKATPITRDTFSLLSTLMVLSKRTFGYFNFSMGKITAPGRFDTDYAKVSQVVPPDARQDMPLASYEAIALDKEQGTVSFLSDKVSLDSGGFGKGYGLDRLKPVFERFAVQNAFLSFGESAVMGVGSHPYGNAWRAGLVHLFRDQESVWYFDLADEVMSVSGNTPANMAKYGRGHMVNPLTQEAAGGYAQVAVAGRHGLFAEVLSTALYVTPPRMRQAVVDNFPGYRGIIVDYDADHEARITYTFGL